MNPRDLVPESNMPGYPWLAERPVEAAAVLRRLAAQRALGVPYAEEDFASVAAVVAGKTELDALIAYLQGLGIAVGQRR
jgi:cytochrome c oxidase cbb3-type subunit 2